MWEVHSQGDQWTEIHGSSWDIRRVIDTIRKPILEMSWQRLSVSEWIAEYIVGMGISLSPSPHKPYTSWASKDYHHSRRTLPPFTWAFFLSQAPRKGTLLFPQWNASLNPLLWALNNIDLPPPWYGWKTNYARLKTQLTLANFSQSRQDERVS